MSMHNSIKVTLLGTNGWYDTGTGNTICTLIDCPEYKIILDAGNGLYKMKDYPDDGRPVFLFLSHFHIDHIEGLHMLVLIKTKKLTVIGQRGTEDFLKSFLKKPLTVPIDALPFQLDIIELPEGSSRLPFSAVVLPMVHAVETFGIRIESAGKIITYCPDTGYCENAVTLSLGADLVISECAFLPGEENEGWPHLNPEKGALIAKNANAKKLILTHFDASRYQTLELRKEAEKVARKVFSESSVGHDGMLIEV